MKEKFDRSKWITTGELAAVLGIKPTSVQQQYQRGALPLPSTKVGRRRLYLKASVREWVLDRLVAAVDAGLVTFDDIL